MKIDDEKLHLYFDGALSPTEAEEVRALVAEDGSLQAKLDGLAEVREVVRAVAARDAAAVDPEADAMFARIQAQIAPIAAPPAPTLRAIEGGRARQRPAAKAAEKPNYLPIAIGLLAFAAVALIAIWGPGLPGDDADPIATGPADAGATATPDMDTALAAIGTEILEVDFGTNSGTIFAVEGDEGERYAVVWLADIRPKQMAQ